jgi:hypothetical protein
LSRINAYLEGEQILAGKEVFKIVITDTKGEAIAHIYFDVNNGLKVREEAFSCNILFI